MLDGDERNRPSAGVHDACRGTHPTAVYLVAALARKPVEIAVQECVPFTVLHDREGRNRSGAVETVRAAVDDAGDTRVRPEQLPPAMPRPLPRLRSEGARGKGRGLPRRAVEELHACRSQ